MKRRKDIGRAISVSASSYEQLKLKAGRLKIVYRPLDDWNRAKFCLQPVKWLYVCKTNDVTGECLRLGVEAVLETTLTSGIPPAPVILIQLGDVCEVLNRQAGERTFHFPPKTPLTKPHAILPRSASFSPQSRVAGMETAAPSD